MIESATFWKNSPEIETGEIVPDGVPHRGVLLPRRVAHREGGHVHPDPADAAVAGEGGRAPGRPALGAVVLLPPRAPAPGAPGGLDRRARHADPGPHLGLRGRTATSRAPSPCSRPINGYDLTTGKPSSTVTWSSRTTVPPRAAAGSTRASTRTASTRPPGARRATRADPTSPALEWGWVWPYEPAHPLQPRLGRPAGRARGASARSTSGGTRQGENGEWTGHDVPDFETTKPPSYEPPEGAVGPAALARRRPVRHAGRRQGLAVRPHGAAGRPAADALRAGRVGRSATRCTSSRPTRPARSTTRPGQPVQPARRRSGSDPRSIPYVFTTSAGSPSTTPRAG